MKIIPALSALLLATTTFAQTATKSADSPKRIVSIDGNVSITNNGFSFIPAFTLDKPAIFGYATIDAKKFSLSGDFRFEWNGRPWSIAIIPTYKLVNTDKTQVFVGAQFPALGFSDITAINNGVSTKVTQVLQSVTPQVNANFQLTKSFGLGVTYLYNRGIFGTLPKNGHYFGLAPGFNNIKLSRSLTLSANAQVFYLYIDGTDGYYTSWALSLSKSKSPFSISKMGYRTIKSNVGGKRFDWGLSLVYSFGSKFSQL